jgi:TrmH family RNA methyltransferase
VLAWARRPDFTLPPPSARLTVLLDHPRHLGTWGAAIRVCAAAGAAAVLVTGRADPWHPSAIRGAAGLQFALPVANVESVPPGPLVALDPDGDPLGALPRERSSRSARSATASRRRSWTARTDGSRCRCAPGVSSLNLATAVAATLYSTR